MNNQNVNGHQVIRNAVKQEKAESVGAAFLKADWGAVRQTRRGILRGCSRMQRRRCLTSMWYIMHGMRD